MRLASLINLLLAGVLHAIKAYDSDPLHATSAFPSNAATEHSSGDTLAVGELIAWVGDPSSWFAYSDNIQGRGAGGAARAHRCDDRLRRG